MVVASYHIVITFISSYHVVHIYLWLSGLVLQFIYMEIYMRTFISGYHVVHIYLLSNIVLLFIYWNRHLFGDLK